MNNLQACLVTIGDELLIGQVIDTNSAWIAQQLNTAGIDVVKRIAVGDTDKDIRDVLDAEIPGADIVIITGGLGPTSDDITKPLLCNYFGGNLVVDERVKAHLLDIFARRNRPILERNMMQAEVPDNCTVLFNKMGTAPGMWFTKGKTIIISLPGVPFEMMGIMENEVLPRLRILDTGQAIVHRTIFTAGEGESAIAEKIIDIEDALPTYIKLAYLPNAGMVRLRLTGRGDNEDALQEEVTCWQHKLAERLGNIVIVLEDLPLQEILGKTLIAKNLTVGFAESCTGGCVGHYMTQVSGSSAYFNGSMVCYQNSIKESVLGVKEDTLEKHGAVSEQTAIEMAKGAQRMLGADYTLSVTGTLGPFDHGIKSGDVWMAVVYLDEIVTRKFTFFYDRPRNKEMAVQMGMLLLWRVINGKL
jgi:nicotinamide-nucleotide amidase